MKKIFCGAFLLASSAFANQGTVVTYDLTNPLTPEQADMFPNDLAQTLNVLSRCSQQLDYGYKIQKISIGSYGAHSRVYTLVTKAQLGAPIFKDYKLTIQGTLTYLNDPNPPTDAGPKTQVTCSVSEDFSDSN